MIEHRTPRGGGSQEGPPLLRVHGLTVSFSVPAGRVYAVNGIDFELMPGSAVAVVGESGSGKTVTCRAVLGLLPDTAEVRARSLSIAGYDVARDPGLYDCVRGSVISLVGQEPATGLNPHVPIGAQLRRVLLTSGCTPPEAEDRLHRLLTQVGIDPDRGSAYPSEFSGGMCQRIAIALALASGARLLVADEPTSSLDVTTQARILELLRRLRDDEGLTLLMVTHDIEVARAMCDRLLVMYGGIVVEEGPSQEVALHPRHPYTRGLLAAVPTVDERSRALRGIPGTARVPSQPLAACPFAPRCDRATDACRGALPARESYGEAHYGRCFHPIGDHAAPSAASAVEPRSDAAITTSANPDRAEPIPVIAVDDLSVVFPVRRGIFLGREIGAVEALTNVSFSVHRGEVLGVIGETGAGKSTLLRSLLRLEPTATGVMVVNNTDVSEMTEEEFRPYRELLQVVFQDPSGSLDPTYRAADAVAEPLAHLRHGGRADRWRAAVAALGSCGLAVGTAERRTGAFSGGQKQRIAISRAIADPPGLLLADEPVSALDVSVQAGVINLLRDLVRNLRFGMVFVSHDLAVIRAIADTILVLRAGAVVEYTAAHDFFSHPGSDYGRELLAAARSGSERHE
jgi:peptide/nickel transport system ATP-binding protein